MQIFAYAVNFQTLEEAFSFSLAYIYVWEARL